MNNSSEEGADRNDSSKVQLVLRPTKPCLCHLRCLLKTLLVQTKESPLRKTHSTWYSKVPTFLKTIFLHGQWWKGHYY